MKRAVLGTWSVICDVCGFRFRSDEVKKRWDGLITCEKDWEIKHPQLTIRVPKEDIAPPFTRPEPAEISVGPVCYFHSRQAYADIGEADCMQADITTISYSLAKEMKGI